MRDYTPSTIRAIRKYYGLGQRHLAELIGVSQGKLSKLEAGILVLSAVEWMQICTKYNIDPAAITTGRIEKIENLKLDIHLGEIPGSFKVDAKYQMFMGSTVRTVYPFIRFMESKIGESPTRNFFKSIGIDPDYFVIQNLPINIKVTEEIFNFLYKRGHLSAENCSEVIDAAPVGDTHNYFLSQIPDSLGEEKRFKKLISEIPKLYEINSTYGFVGEKDCYIKVRDNDHLKEFRLSSEFTAFRKEYGLQQFNSLSPYLFSDKSFYLNIEEDGWSLGLN